MRHKGLVIIGCILIAIGIFFAIFVIKLRKENHKIEDTRVDEILQEHEEKIKKTYPVNPSTGTVSVDATIMEYPEKDHSLINIDTEACNEAMYELGFPDTYSYSYEINSASDLGIYIKVKDSNIILPFNEDFEFQGYDAPIGFFLFYNGLVPIEYQQNVQSYFLRNELMWKPCVITKFDEKTDTVELTITDSDEVITYPYQEVIRGQDLTNDGFLNEDLEDEDDAEEVEGSE